MTDTEAFASFGGDLGLNVQVGRYIRFRGLFGLAGAAPHFITAASAGVDADSNGRVDATNRDEANPVYRESIDLPGRRFRVEGTKIVDAVSRRLDDVLGPATALFQAPARSSGTAASDCS